MLRKTALNAAHADAGAKLVDFAGWEMPLHYGSQIEEHKQVRAAAGMFDVSHMATVDITGSGAEAYLQYLVANNVSRLGEAQALYTAMLNTDGGVIDDLIVYRRGAGYRTVVNAGRRDVDLAWMRQVAADFEVDIAERTDLGIIAIQGPEALQRAAPAVAQAAGTESDSISALEGFHALHVGDWMIGRTGYTGEDGIEVVLPNDAAVALWNDLLAAGVTPAGLGARDTLRLEGGLNLYGHEMDEAVSPLEANMAWTIAWQPAERDFVGRTATEALRGNQQLKLTGVVLTGRGVVREGQRIDCGDAGEGIVTSGIFSPTLGKGIGLVRVPRGAKGDCAVEIRGKAVPAKLVKPPFVRNGQILID